MLLAVDGVTVIRYMQMVASCSTVRADMLEFFYKQVFLHARLCRVRNLLVVEGMT